MRSFLDTLMIAGRLRIGHLGALGALATGVGFGIVPVVMICVAVIRAVSGVSLFPGSESFDDPLDMSMFVVLPLGFLAFVVLGGRLFLSQDEARERQKNWTQAQWEAWNAQDLYSLAYLNFVLSAIGVVVLMCLASLVLVVLIEA